MDVVGLVALCYHKVGTEAAEGRRLNIHPDRLDCHIRHFKRRGYRFIRGSEAVHWFDEKAVCFTFDDGFASTLENGAPIFERNEVPMTVYIVSEKVGRTSDWAGETPRPLAGWSSLAELQDMGHEIGNHSASHPRFAELQVPEQVEQIVRCRDAMIEQGLRSESFCYPYGSLAPESPGAVAKSGYKVGMALGKRLPKPTDSFLAIPRIVVAYGDGLPLLLYKLHVKPLLKRYP